MEQAVIKAMLRPGRDKAVGAEGVAGRGAVARQAPGARVSVPNAGSGKPISRGCPAMSADVPSVMSPSPANNGSISAACPGNRKTPEKAVCVIRFSSVNRESNLP
jgi:hypothetical protein